MSNFKFSPDLFLDVAELERFKLFLDDVGFRKNIRDNSIKFGLIKSNATPLYRNGRVEQDFDNSSGQKTIKIQEVNALNKDGLFLHQDVIRGYPVPADGQWYWIRISHQYSNIEKGIYSIGLNGLLTCTNGQGELTKILRGMPNFPSRIKFEGFSQNNLEYDVLEVIDDNNAILQHPSVNSGGVSAFNPESGLSIKVVGTFTPGVAISNSQKYPFEYDSCKIELVLETSTNSRPAYIPGREFYLSRVSVQGGNLTIQDKRTDVWETKGSELCIAIDRVENPLIGVEAAKWDHEYSPSEKNLVEVSWGARTINWTVDSSKNIVTLLDIVGGRYKTTNDFVDGNFNNWRIYTSNGKYSRVITSVRQGSAINLTLDVLDLDDYSPDGGLTFLNEYVLVVPDCEEVEIKFIPDINDNLGLGFEREFNFPTNTLMGKCDILVYKAPYCLYTVMYRYKSYKEYTDWTIIPSDITHGYLQEVSFTNNGVLRAPIDRVYKTYISTLGAAFIQLNLCPWAYHNVINTIYKGDLIDVLHITNIGISTIINLNVGVTPKYIYVSGNNNITNNVYFMLSDVNVKKGNEFRVHFECSQLGLNGANVFIAQTIGNSTIPIIIKTIDIADVFSMMNQDGGICFDLVYEGTTWVMYQNYTNDTPLEIKTIDGVKANLFDSSGWGKVKGLYGHAICDGSVTGAPDLSGRFIIGEGSYTDSSGTYNYALGNVGGEAKHQLTIAELAQHGHVVQDLGHAHIISPPYFKQANGPGQTGNAVPKFEDNATGSVTQIGYANILLQLTGNDEFHENRPPYYTLMYCKKMY